MLQGEWREQMTKLAVVDGDKGADVYGYAENEADAKVVAESCFADQVSHVERYGPILLANGETLPEAYVAFTVTA